jgi:DNA-binding phage protein
MGHHLRFFFMNLFKYPSKNGSPKLQTIGVLLKGLGFAFSIKAT